MNQAAEVIFAQKLSNEVEKTGEIAYAKITAFFISP